MEKSLYTSKPSAALISRSQKIADALTRAIEPFPQGIQGRGIVTCAGGYKYFPNAWILIRMLRHLGCKLPIQLWHLGPMEVNARMKRLVAKFGVECVDGIPIIEKNTHFDNERVKRGWVLKSVAVARCPFEEVLFLDADNLPIRDPSFLFDMPQYKATGALFWPDSSVFVAKSVWRVFRVPPRTEPEFESGQFLVDKRINWEAVSLAEKFNFRADPFYRLMWGDKDTFRFAWHKLGRSFAMPKFPPQALQAPGSDADMLCQHDFQGARLFQHRIMYKWNLLGENPWIPGFFFENECRTWLEELKSVWDGRCGNHTSEPRAVAALPVKRDLLKKIWLLKLPQIPSKKNAAVACCPPSDNSRTWIELGFAKNGTLRKGAGEKAGIFWDLRNSAAGWRLTLSDEKGPKVQLRQVENGWQGHWLDEAGRRKAKLLPLEEIYPHLKKEIHLTTSKTRKEIRRHFGEEVHLRHSAAGIGDHISAACACARLARTGVRVVFHSPHFAWLARIKEPGLIISQDPAKRPTRNIEYDSENQLKYGVSRTLWYAGGLHPLLKPVKPRVDRKQTRQRLPFERYILLAPFTGEVMREWIDIHWIRLAHLLREQGYEVVAIGGKRDAQRLRKTFGKTQVYWVTNYPPDWVMDAMLGAVAFVGIDSGMTHLAALMGINAVAIHSQLEPEFLWPGGAVKSITPSTGCVFCHRQEERGWSTLCQSSCSAMASISPEAVLKTVLEFESRPLSKSNAPIRPDRHNKVFPNGDTGQARESHPTIKMRNSL